MSIVPTSSQQAQGLAKTFELNDVNHVEKLTNSLENAERGSKMAKRIVLEEYKQLANNFYTAAKEIDGLLNEETFKNAIYTIPKGKLPWVKFLWNFVRGNGKKTNPVDFGLLKNLWMNKSKLKIILDNWAKVNPVDAAAPKLPVAYPTRSKTTFQFDPKTQTVSGGGMFGTNDKGDPVVFVANPGLYEPLTESMIQFNDEADLIDYMAKRNGWRPADYHQQDQQQPKEIDVNSKVRKLSTIFDIIDEKMNEIKSLTRIQQKTNMLDELPMDPKMHRLIDYARKILYESHLSIDDMEKIAEGFSYIRDISQSKYILQLIDPFNHATARIPSLLPIPSVNFTLRSRFNLVTNNIGNVAFNWQPVALYPFGTNYSSFAVNNDASLTGIAVSNNFICQDIGQVLPANFYSRFRVVSAGISLAFTASALNSSGFAVLGVSFGEYNALTAVGAVNASLAGLSIFNTIENSYFLQHAPSNSGEAIQCNYIPIDDSFLDYINIATASKTGFTIVGYMSGQPASQAVARLDFVATYEALVDLTYTDYLPVNIYTGSSEDIRIVTKMANQISQKQAPLTPDNLAKAYNETKPISESIYIGLPPREAQRNDDLDRTTQEIKQSIIAKEAEEVPQDQKKSFLSKAIDVAFDIGSALVPGLGIAKTIKNLGTSIYDSITSNRREYKNSNQSQPNPNYNIEQPPSNYRLNESMLTPGFNMFNNSFRPDRMGSSSYFK
jgi:hypothetical protein